MNRQLFSGRPEGNGTHRGRRLSAWRWISLLLAAAMSLACMTVEIGFKVVHQADQEDQVTLTIAQHFTEKYIQIASQANKELREEYAKVGKKPAFEFPESMQKLSGEQPEMTLLDPKAMPGEFDVKEDASGFTATATLTLAKWLEKLAESDQKWLQVDPNDPEGTRYIFELDLPAMGDPNEDPKAFFDALAQLRREGMPPKPKLETKSVEPPDADKIAEELKAGRSVTETRAITLSGLDRLLGGALAAMPGLEGGDLESWYVLRILVEAGLPEFRWAVELPGEIVAHQVDDQMAGQIEGNRVTLVMDEAFFRQFGFGEHRFRVESVLGKRETVEIYSIPKDLDHYRFAAKIPSLVPQRQDAPTFEEMYYQFAGELEIVFSYSDHDGKLQQRSFRKPLSDLIPRSEEARLALAQEGEMRLEGPTTLILEYKVLDELEKITKDPQNAQQQIREGEKIFRGSELVFDWQVILYDEKGVVARSNPGSPSLKYVIRYPIVFVPGTAASRLSADGEEVWPANIYKGDTDDLPYWGALELNEGGGGIHNVTATDVFRYYGQTWGIISLANVYQGFLEHMAAQGYKENAQLFLFPYDWRLNITGHVNRLDALIDRALELNYNRRVTDSGSSERPPYERQETDKVILIGHSQGGLVMRAYVKDPAKAEKVEDFIMLGTPNWGSFNTFRALGGKGYNFEAPWLHPEVGKFVGRNWYSPYQMLPASPSGGFARFLFDDQGRAVTDTLSEMKNLRTHVFCAIQRPLYGDDVSGQPECRASTLNPSRLDEAVGFLRGLPNPVDRGIRTFIIASHDQPTLTAFRRDLMRTNVSKIFAGRGYQGAIPHDVLPRGGYLPPEVLWQDSYRIVDDGWTSYTVELPYYAEVFARCGDGTVPLHSIIDLAGAEVIFVEGVKHGGLTEAPIVQSHIDRLLQGVRPVGVLKPSCDSSPRPFSNGVQVTARGSPANLHVYDAQGRHTGLTPEGMIEEGIPGSRFDLLGETQQVWLPYTDEALKVVLEGLVETGLDVNIVAYDGQAEKRVEYLGIQETPTMRGEIRFTPSTLGEETYLEIDHDGDEKIDETRQPDLVSEAGGPSPTPESAILRGDANSDGLCTEADAQVAMQMAMGQLAEDLKMDVDQDGRVTESDAFQILRWAASGGQCQAGAAGEVRPTLILTATVTEVPPPTPVPTPTATKIPVPIPTATPTNTPTPTQTLTDTPTPTPTPTPTATPPPALTPLLSPYALPGQAIEHPETGLAFRSHAVLPSEDGKTLTAIGEVENISAGLIETGYYQLWFTPYDATGQVIQTEYDLVTDLLRPVLAPGQKSPFLDSVIAGVEVSADFMARIDHYVVEIRPTGRGPSLRLELSVQDLAWSPGGQVTGLVRNDTEFTTDRYGPSVWLTQYDASGRVVDITSAFPEWWFLAPGETRPFSSWSNIPREVASLDALAYGYPVEGLIFYDNFSNPASGWETYTSEDGEVHYEEGTLALVARGPDRYAAVRCPGIQPQDFRLSLDATPLSEPGDWEYGVSIRHVAGGNSIYFTLTADGRYSVYEAVDGKFVPLVDYTPSEAIETSGSNYIMIYAEGPRLTFYVNGERLGEVTAAQVRQGEIIFWAYTRRQQEVKVAFDNVVMEGEELTPTPTPTWVAMLAPTAIPTPPLAEAALAQPIRNKADVQRWVYQSLEEDMNNNGEQDFDDNELYILDQVTGKDARLTRNQFGDAAPAWSPSGELIAFVSDRDGDETELYVMARDGSNPVRLTSDRLWDGWPNWSPSGQAIFYLHATEPGPTEKHEIRSVVFKDGRPTAEQTVLTLPPADDRFGPWFLVDSEAIVFELCDYSGDEPLCAPWRYDLPQAGDELPGAPQPVRLKGDFEIYDQSAFPWLIVSWAEYRGR